MSGAAATRFLHGYRSSLSSIQSVVEMLFDQQRIQIDTTAIPNSIRAGYTIPLPVYGSGTSFTPVQQTINITSISRSNDVVTVVLPSDIPYLNAGDLINITHDNNGGILDTYGLTGAVQVSEIISRVPSGGTNILTFTYLSGGSICTVDNEGQAVTRWADYGRTVYFEPLLGGQTLGHTFIGMTAGTPWLGTGALCTPASPQQAGGNANPNPWTAYCSLQGKTAVFVRLTYDSKYYDRGLPQISFHVQGKNDIIDYRTSPPTIGYTDNPVLCIADFLTNQAWGFKASYGQDVPTVSVNPENSVDTGLNAMATICDQRISLARGGTEAMYSLNGQFDLTMRRGEILQNMLTSCAGRLVYIGGQYFIQPGYWVGPGSPATQVNLTAIAAGGYKYKGISITELYNGVKGTFISPENKWQSTDYPYYAQDTMHGYSGPSQYGGDINLAGDGGDRRWLELHLPFTISPSMAQRIAKINLLRRRWRWSGTFPLNMAGYQFAPLDVFEATIPYLGFSNKLLEISATRLRAGENEGTIVLVTEIDVQETDSDIYAWAIEEELSPQGYVQAAWPTGQVAEVSPWPWSPGYVAPLPGDAIGGAASFGIQPIYDEFDTQGNPSPSVQIKGTPPINVLNTGVAKPQISVSVSPTGGTLLAGTYYVGLSAFDSGSSSRENTDYLNLGIAYFPPGTTAGSITVTVKWGSGDDGGDLYIAEWKQYNNLTFHYQQTLASGAASATVTSFTESTAGGPDDLFDHFGITWKQIIHGGIWAQQIQNVTSNTITIASYADGDVAIDQWAGYTISLLAKYDSTVEIPILNMPVESNTASGPVGSPPTDPPEFTLTIGTNSLGVQLPDLTTLLAVGDLLVMRHRATFTATTMCDPNIANIYFPTGATGVEAGTRCICP